MEVGGGVEGVEQHHLDKADKRLAVFITVIGLFLAIAETMAKGAQTQSIAANVQASNMWAFYQAKTIRQTTLKTAAEQMEVDVALARDPAVKARLEARVADWKAEVARYQSEPKTGPHHENLGEGRNELQQRALAAEEARERYENKYHAFEIAAAAFQIAIVIAGVYFLTHVLSLLLLVTGLVGVGLVFGGIGLLAPSLVHAILPH